MKRQKYLFYNIIIWLAIFTNHVLGQLWSQENLYGGPISCLAKDNSGNLYAGNYGGIVFGSKDNGETWEKLTDQLDYKWISSILVNPQGDIFVSATTGGGGVYKSMDNGLSWNILENGLKKGNYYYYIYSLAINQKGYLFAAGEGIFRSKDNGNSWKKITNGLTGQYQIYIRNIVINDQNQVFIINGYNGVYRSDNNGDSWEYLGFKGRDISCIGINSEGTVYVATNGLGNVYSSIDNGNSWEEFAVQINEYGFGSILITPNDDIILSSYYNSDSGNVFLYDNNNDLWKVLDKDFGNYRISSFCYNNEKLIASTFNKGIVGYNNALDIWEDLSYGIYAETIFEICQSSTLEMYAVGKGGVYCKEANYWKNISYNLKYNTSTSVSLNSKDNIYTSTSNGFYRLDSSRTYWKKISGISGIFFIDKNDYIYIEGSKNLYKSTDSGNSFHKLNSSPFSSFIRAIHIDNNGNIFIGTQDGYIYKSVNSGSSWNKLDYYFSRIDGIVSNFKADIFIVSSNAVFKITNVQNEIQKLRNIPYDTNTSNSITINDKGDLFVSFIDGLITSKDDGETWEDFSSGLSHRKVKSMFVDQNGYLWLGSDGNGLWKSGITTTLKDKNIKFEIGKNYPNPFNGKSIIPIKIYSPGNYNLQIFNLLGQKVNNLYSGFLDIGAYEFEWAGTSSNNSSISSGLYFYQLAGSNGLVKTGKAVYIK